MKLLAAVLALSVPVIAQGQEAVYPYFGLNSDDPDSRVYDSFNLGLTGQFPTLPSITMLRDFQAHFQQQGVDVLFDTKLYEKDDGDLNIRFQKVGNLVEGFQAKKLNPEDFPITLETAAWLRKSQCWSVTAEDDCHECEIPFYIILKELGGCPAHPNSDPNHAYWDEFREVIGVQKLRRAGEPPISVANLTLATVWKDYNLTEVANAVKGEYPGWNQQLQIIRLIEQKTPMDTTIVRSKSVTEFLKRDVMLADLNTWAIHRVGFQNFGMKFTCGRARPEEVAWLIETDKLAVADGVPQDIFDDVKAMKLTRADDFTAYFERGCPHHPSWPAMHSAASVSSMWLPVVFDLTDDQVCEVRKIDYGVAYARTVAGVHYRQDNIAGLNLGSYMLEMYLPQKMYESYGSDPAVVLAKIKKYRFDWNTFVDTECFQTGKF